MSLPQHGCVNVRQLPIRTCVGCGKRHVRSGLIRVVAVAQGSAQVDLARNQPGRGAWIHAELTCIAKAQQRKAFERALRLPQPIGESIWVELKQIAQEEVSVSESENDRTDTQYE